jgi:hypothetical protein
MTLLKTSLISATLITGGKDREAKVIIAILALESTTPILTLAVWEIIHRCHYD